MAVLHDRHFPRSTANETSGTLSYHAIRASHDMQDEGGLTTDRRSGTRAATTLRKLPSASAGAKTKTAATAFTSEVSAGGAERLSA